MAVGIPAGKALNCTQEQQKSICVEDDLKPQNFGIHLAFGKMQDRTDKVSLQTGQHFVGHWW